MKTHITILFSLFIIVGNAQSNYRKINTINECANFRIVEDFKHKLNIEYPTYSVSLKNQPYKVGERITVTYCYDTILSIEGGPIYFYGIYENFLFIDKGTGSIRDLMIYNLSSQNFIFNTRLTDPPILKEDSIVFYYPIPVSKSYPSFYPKCHDSITKNNLFGYSEKRIFILSESQLVKTEVYKCGYRE